MEIGLNILYILNKNLSQNLDKTKFVSKIIYRESEILAKFTTFCKLNYIYIL